MAEYIERKAAIKAVMENDCEGYATWAIKAIPAADVQPVRHGRWINHGWYIVCSECGDEEYDCDGRDYCPNCGAKMEVDNGT